MFIKNTYSRLINLHYVSGTKIANLPIASNATIQANFISSIDQIVHGTRLYTKGWIRTGTTLSATTILKV